VEGALEHARNEGYQVIPSCWYVKRWVERHPDYAGLLRE
jgi:predicted GNAT family acetyltransferase